MTLTFLRGTGSRPRSPCRPAGIFVPPARSSTLKSRDAPRRDWTDPANHHCRSAGSCGPPWALADQLARGRREAGLARAEARVDEARLARHEQPHFSATTKAHRSLCRGGVSSRAVSQTGFLRSGAARRAKRREIDCRVARRGRSCVHLEIFGIEDETLLVPIAVFSDKARMRPSILHPLGRPGDTRAGKDRPLPIGRRGPARKGPRRRSIARRISVVVDSSPVWRGPARRGDPSDPRRLLQAADAATCSWRRFSTTVLCPHCGTGQALVGRTAPATV